MKNVLIVIFAISLCMITKTLADQGHSFNALNAGKKETCSYCHRVTYSTEQKSLWTHKKISDTTYKFISSGVVNDAEVIRVSNKLRTNRMSELCIGCHNDYSKHTANFHPISFNASETLQSKLDGNGKVGGNLPLYDGFLECSSCHNPHSKEKKYLRTAEGQICKDCHDK